MKTNLQPIFELPGVRVFKMDEADTFDVWVEIERSPSIPGHKWECHSSGIPTAWQAREVAVEVSK